MRELNEKEQKTIDLIKFITKEEMKYLQQDQYAYKRDTISSVAYAMESDDLLEVHDDGLVLCPMISIGFIYDEDEDKVSSFEIGNMSTVGKYGFFQTYSEEEIYHNGEVKRKKSSRKTILFYDIKNGYKALRNDAGHNTLDINSFSKIISEKDGMINISTEHSSFFMVDLTRKTFESFDKIIGSIDLVQSNKSIKKHTVSGDSIVILSIYSKLIAGKRAWFSKVMEKKEESLLKSFGWRTEIRFDKIVLHKETDERYVFLARVLSVKTESTKSLYFSLDKKTGDVEIVKDNGFAGFLIIEDEIGNTSVALYNTTSNRLFTLNQTDNFKISNFSNGTIMRGKGAVNEEGGFVVDPVKHIVKPKLLKTAVVADENSAAKRYSTEESITMIVKDNSLYFREHDLKGVSWSNSIDVKYILEKKITDLKPGQEKFLIDFFNEGVSDVMAKSASLSNRGYGNIFKSYVDTELRFDKKNNKLFFLKYINEGGIKDILAGGEIGCYILRQSLRSMNDTAKAEVLMYLRKQLKNQSVYIFDISDGGFKTEKKYTMDKRFFSDKDAQLAYLKGTDQATLDLESIKNKLI